jgi:acyl dehydratase
MSERSETSGPAKNALAVDPTPFYFEDYAPDWKLEGGTYHVTEAEILEFGRRFDPQPFHVDPEAAQKGPFGGLIAPGCLTFSIRQALYNQLPVRPVLVAGLGLETMDLPTPVRPGDMLHLVVEVAETRRSRSRPDRGIVATRQSVINQNGETVLTMIAKMIVRARSEASGAP